MCERLGLTLGELEETMSVRELRIWEVRDRNHFSQSWHQAAMLASLLANCHAAEGKKFEHEEFLPYVVDTAEVDSLPSDERVEALLMTLVRK